MSRLEREDSKEIREPWALRHAGKIIIAGAVLAGAVTLCSLTFLPRIWGSSRISSPVKPVPTEVQSARVDAENNVRDTGLKIAAGVGAIAAALVSWGRIDLSRREQLREERGQQSERFGRAVDQLGSDKQEVRLGGVYSLEQLYRDTPAERNVIAEVLASFVRSNLPPRKRVNDVALRSRPSPLPADIAGALSVLGRLAPRPSKPIDLTGVDFSVGGRYAADLRGAQLHKAIFDGVDLTDALLEEANLSECSMMRVTLARARLNSADLSGAVLIDVNFTGADVHATEFDKAVLSRISPDVGALSAAHLTNAILREP